MRLIVGRLIAGDIFVVHVQKKRLRASRWIRPADRRRQSFASCHAGCRLCELDRNIAAVWKTWDGERHRRSGRRPAALSTRLLPGNRQRASRVIVETTSHLVGLIRMLLRPTEIRLS
jgi:hypothetical protein